MDFNNKEDLINLVLSATNKVEKNYYCKDEGAYVYEKGFSYEFYHQFRLLLQPFEDVIINGEPYKNLETNIYMRCEKLNSEYKISNPDCKELYIKNVKMTYPDFILHKGLNDVNSENQFIAIEVKREKQIDNTNRENGRTPFENDIWKLRFLIENLGFKIGV